MLRKKVLIGNCFTMIFLMLTLGACSAIKPKWNFEWVDNGDIETIHNRMLSNIYDDDADPSEIILDINEDGSFKSIDYFTDKKDTWQPAKHLENILLMQTSYYSQGNLYYKNNDLLNKINLAIDFWTKNDFVCEWNGWWNGLGIGPKIANILLLANDDIKENDKQKLATKLYNISCFKEEKKYNVKQRETDSTGGNLTDKVNHSLKYAVIMHDGEGIKFLRRLIENELKVFPKHKWLGNRFDAEGIKADMSFLQHYEMLYMGGYGEVFVDGINEFVELTTKTQFSLAEEKLNFYQNFLLDGMQYAFRGEYRDINASGRGIVREDELKGIYSQVKKGCQVLLASGVSLSRHSELRYILDTRTQESDIGAGGHKYFWNSDYSVYNDTNYMASVRGASKRTKNSEALNGENIWGHYLGAGSTMFYNKGDEYYNILPLFNWNRVPGTTSIQGFLPKGGDKTYSRMGKTSFVGGISNGKIGMSMLDYDDNNVDAKKSWFMFEKGVVCLGTDISSNKKGDLYTNINQTLLRDDLVYSERGVIKTTREMQSMLKTDWVYNNGIGYIYNGDLKIDARERTGDWKSISERVSSKIHKDTVLEIGFSHGNKPKNSSYEYTVVMNTTPEKINAYYKNPSLTVIKNDKTCQAVWDAQNNTMMAVFWKNGYIKLPNGVEISANKGCSLIYEVVDNSYKLTVSNPLQNGRTITIKVNDEKHKIKTPRGEYAGQSIIVK